ncbi:Quinone oxidoreductase 2-like protein [Cladobotryum mycophilum]|uniref:Quinone oxidoreductase 2-like protein n=1 Tax=Cladobotryum mycophilum TaxID=491253 RepID=A0ABR0SVP2_9HYPO
MIVLTGSTGGIGRSVLTTLLSEKLVPISQLRISAYNTAAIPAAIRDAGIEIRQGNLYEPSTLVESYAGAEVLFLVSFPSMGEERFTLHRNAIDAAKAAGVRHIIYTSLSFCGGATKSTSVAQVAQAHLRTEAYLKEAGVTYTCVRMASYAHLWNNFAGFLDLNAAPDAVLEAVLPNDGLEHWANRSELGEATARIIANWQNYINKTIDLTGPELLSGADIVNKYTKYTGRKVNFRVLPVDEAIAWHIKNGSVPPEQNSFLDNWASWHTAISLGEKAFIDPDLEQLLGRKPKTIDDQAEEIFAPSNVVDTKDLVGI